MRRDAFTFSTPLEKSAASTKRKILSTIARIFDPAGWLTPTTILARITIHQLWLLGMDWDDKVPETIVAQWDEYHNELSELKEVSIPRHKPGTSTNSTAELHGFCDASKQAYAAVVYFRIPNANNEADVYLIMGKSKVAPLKHQTIAKLELCAAHLLSRVLERVRTAMNLQIHPIHAWTDSQIVLAWL